MPWVASHYGALRSAYQANRTATVFKGAWGKKKAGAWARSIGLSCAPSLPEEVLSRGRLREDLATADDPCLAAALVLAWGEMRADQGRRLFAQRDWLSLIEPLRKGKWNREEAYRAFADQRARGQTSGMGPAYFTKLIYFLRPTSSASGGNGYIMDQWTASSINLLRGEPVVAMVRNYGPRGGFRVSDRNRPGSYETFNLLIELIAQEWGAPGEQVEMTLFGRGGRNPDSWRQYVRAALQAPKLNE